MAFVFFLLYLTLTYLRPYEFYPSLAPYRPMLTVGGLGLLIVALYIPLSGFTFRAKQLPLVLSFVLWASMSLVIALRWFGGAVQTLNELGITLISFVLATFSINTDKRLRIALSLIVFLSLILVLQDFLALHFGIFRDLLIMEQVLDNGSIALRARATGFMKDPNDLAQGLLTAVPFVALAWRPKSFFRNTIFTYLPMAILLFGIYLTGSRGALVGLAVMTFISIRPALGNLLSGAAMGLGALGMLAITFGGRSFGLDASVIGRLEAWSTGLQLLKQHPLAGVGYGRFTDFNRITAHNSFVLCFSELGLPGFFIWIALLLVTILELNAIRNLPVKTEADASLRRMARSVQIALYSFLVSAWFLSRTYVATLYLLIAFAIATAEIARRSGKQIDLISIPTLAWRTMVASIACILLVYLQIIVQVR